MKTTELAEKVPTAKRATVSNTEAWYQKYLDESELAMLELTCSRTGIENGQRVLDLGCGWGSLSLYLAECYPQSRITAVSTGKAPAH